MKKRATVCVQMPEELLRKLLYLCEAEHRTPSNQFTFMLRNSIQYFERTKGNMDAAKLAAYDVTPYLAEGGSAPDGE